MYKENLNRLALYSFYAIIFIFIFYFWTVSEGRFEFFLRGEESHYNYLAHSFLNKKLSLPFTPPKELLKMPNPYDSNKNYRFRDSGFQDLSLYKGKIYLYFGPTPVLLLYIPYHITAKILHIDHENNKYSAKKYLSNRLCALILATLILIVSSIILIYLAITYFNKIPIWMIIFSILVLGFSNLNPYLLRRPHTYEIAILCGVFCQLTSILMFLFFMNKKKIIYLGIGSLFLGLAVGSRLNLVLSSFGILIYLLYFLKKGKLIKASTIISLIAPFALLLIGLGLYNYFRFGNIFECGFQYQLTSSTKRHLYSNSFLPSYIYKNIFFYFCTPITIKNDFPFIFLTTLNSENKRISGMFFLVPYYSFTILTFIILSIRRWKLLRIFFYINNIFIISLPVIINIGFLLIYHSTTLRHSGDFYTLLIVLTSIIWFSIQNEKDIKKTISRSNLLITLAGVISIIIGIAISIEGPDRFSSLSNSNSELFQKIKNCFD